MVLSSRGILPDTLKSVTFSSITDSYANLGSALTNPWRILMLKNTTDKTIFISEDGSNDHYELPAGTTESYDLQANAVSGEICLKKVGTQFQIKGVSGDLPTSGKVIIQGQYT